MMQIIHDVTREDGLQDLLLMEKEELVEDVKVKGSFGCSHHKMVEFKILTEVSITNSRITALDFRTETFGLFRDLLVGGEKAHRSFKEFSRTTSSKHNKSTFSCVEIQANMWQKTSVSKQGTST